MNLLVTRMALCIRWLLLKIREQLMALRNRHRQSVIKTGQPEVAKGPSEIP
jgi:hypothetical protein